MELATGEGKSLVIATVAVIKAIRGIKVDIACSSSILAKRDEYEWRSFFKFFGITSSAIPASNREECSNAYKADIIYGTVHDFSADLLRQDFDGTITRDNREFKCMIVDEVDNLTIDECLTQTFISSKAKGFHYLNSAYLRIWQNVIGFIPLPENKGYFNSPQYFVNAILSLIKSNNTDPEKDTNNNEEFMSDFFGVLIEIQKKHTKFEVILNEVKILFENSESFLEFQKESSEAINKFFTDDSNETGLEKGIHKVMSESFGIQANFCYLDEENNPKPLNKKIPDMKNLLIFPNGNVAVFLKENDAKVGF